MLRKIDKWPDRWVRPKICANSAHYPPGMIVLENGEYEWTCPGCKYKTYFVVNNPTL